MKALETIRSRRSVRTFDGNALRPEDAKKIMDFAEKVENPYDIPIAWRILEAKKYGLNSPVIVGTDVYLAGKMLRIPHAEEAFGYSFEKVVLFSESLGVGTTWIAGTMNRDAFEQAMDAILASRAEIHAVYREAFAGCEAVRFADPRAFAQQVRGDARMQVWNILGPLHGKMQPESISQ